jgi:hypothetical protein
VTGRSLLHGTRAKRLLSDAQWWSARDPLLLRVPLPSIRWRRRVECRCADGSQPDRLGVHRSAITAMSSAWFWSFGATVILSIAGTLVVRRLVSVEVLERHNEVAGFIYAVLGVVYAVLRRLTRARNTRRNFSLNRGGDGRPRL